MIIWAWTEEEKELLVQIREFLQVCEMRTEFLDGFMGMEGEGVGFWLIEPPERLFNLLLSDIYAMMTPLQYEIYLWLSE